MSDHRFADERYARAFIRRQLGEYQLAGITTMTAKQRLRMDALEVISAMRKCEAEARVYAASVLYGPPPHARTGRMRVLNVTTGEITPVTTATAARVAPVTGNQASP